MLKIQNIMYIRDGLKVLNRSEYLICNWSFVYLFPRWVNSLQPARVTRWGGMISTPDAVLQAVIKRSLIDSGCPLSIVNDLIENAHERNWPQGLATLETRQMNRRYYENYVAKRIPGKQAVVVMACENQHMGEDMILEPGLVMIFAHGVEEIL